MGALQGKKANQTQSNLSVWHPQNMFQGNARFTNSLA